MCEADEVSIYVSRHEGSLRYDFPAIRRNQIIDILSRSDARGVQARTRRRREGVGWFEDCELISEGSRRRRRPDLFESRTRRSNKSCKYLGKAGKILRLVAYLLTR